MRTIKMAAEDRCDNTPLFVRASLPRTFRGLGLFAEASLLFFGFYLLAEAIVQPLQADQVSVLGASVMIGLAIILFVYMVRPWRKAALARMEDARQGSPPMDTPLTAFGEAIKARQEGERILQEAEHLPGPM